MSIVASTSGQDNYRADNNNQEPATTFDPTLLKAARNIYQNYCRIHNNKITNQPLGVAIDPKKNRGQLVFTGTPILLPGEFFVPLKQIENEIP